MRVIAGTARSVRLSSLQGEDTRPTTDRVKESVFNMVMPYIADGEVLDLFAGSGALGIEALSRGAKSCTFVENNRPAAEVIRQNLAHTKLADAAKLSERDALSFLEETEEDYSLIFLDPPYDGGWYTPVLSLIRRRGLLRPDGVLVLEKRAGAPLSLPEGWALIKERKYGNIEVWILTTKGEEEHD